MAVAHSSIQTSVTDLLSVVVVLSLLNVIEAQTLLDFQVNNIPVKNGSTSPFTPSTNVIITCVYFSTLPSPTMSEYVSGTFVNLSLPSPQDNKLKYNNISYTIPDSKKKDLRIYRCSTTIIYYVEIRLNFSVSSNSNGPANGGTFTGLNPLIYTISAVILLGTLAIVAIITCWIRARRSFNNRIFRPNTTPQDYFDYINDNEFTPLTSSEFAASLQERPPTYVESEQIEQNVGTDNSSNTDNIPIPPPPQSHSLPSLTRLRVVQLASMVDGVNTSEELRTTQSSVGDHLTADALSSNRGQSSPGELSLLIPITIDDQTTNVIPDTTSELDVEDDPLYT